MTRLSITARRYNPILPFTKFPASLASFIAGRDDSDLLVRLRRRDSEAAGILYDRYGKPAYTLAVHIIKDPALAEDIVAESVLKLWNRVPFFKETRCSALGVWFLAIVFIQAHEYVQQRAGTLSSSAVKESGVEKPVLFQDWPRALDSDRAEETYIGITLLTPDERKVLDAGFLEAIPFSRLAEHFGVSTAEVEHLVGEALKKLSPPSGD